MRFFFDTSVLIAAVSVQHVHHAPSVELYSTAGPGDACYAAHSFAEVYATLTRMPGRQRMSNEQTLLVLDNIRERLTPIALTEQDYHSLISEAAAEGVMGGTIYDALIARCAIKAKASIIYTWNVDHFRRLGADVAKRVRTP